MRPRVAFNGTPRIKLVRSDRADSGAERHVKVCDLHAFPGSPNPDR